MNRRTFIQSSAVGATATLFSPYGIAAPVSYTHLDVYKRQDGKWFNGKKEVNSKVLKVSHTVTQGNFFYYEGVKK